jgi:hypothetical protein
MTRKTFFRKIIKRKQTHEPQITPRVVAVQCEEGPTAQTISAAHQAAGLNTPRANFRLARGPGASLRDPRLARGLRGFVTPTPIPPTGALNALTCRGRPGQKRILATPTLWHRLGIISRRCSANPPRAAIPGTVGELCGKDGVNSVTLCRPLPYGLHVTPLERGRRNPRKEVRTPTLRPHGTTPWRWTSRARLLRHLQSCAAIPAAMPPPRAL